MISEFKITKPKGMSEEEFMEFLGVYMHKEKLIKETQGKAM